MAKKKRIPKWLLKNCGVETRRQFKQLKRKQLKSVLKAWDDFRSGCFYCPGYPRDTTDVDDILRRLKRDLSAKNWGR